MTRHRMTNGIATFNNVQILDMAKTKVETIVENGVHVPLHLGKNAGAFFKNNKKVDHSPEVSTTKTGDYFYLYTLPLINYYHMLLDGVGCLVRYFELLESNKNIKLLNQYILRPVMKYKERKMDLADHYQIVIEAVIY